MMRPRRDYHQAPLDEPDDDGRPDPADRAADRADARLHRIREMSRAEARRLSNREWRVWPGRQKGEQG